MSRFGQKIQISENFQAIGMYLRRSDTAVQSTPKLLEALAEELGVEPTALDLGCGEGNSIELFESLFVAADWHGVDIEDSPEVRARTRQTAKIKTYDGVNLPYPDEFFDLIYTNQVLEHVRYPDKLMQDALRTLKPGGWLIGAVSYLEPFHSYSIFNFTPYGVVSVLNDAGFSVREISAGVDASRLINRQLLNRSSKLRWVWNRNYLHFAARMLGRLARLEQREVQFLMLQYAGHINFVAQRPIQA